MPAAAALILAVAVLLLPRPAARVTRRRHTAGRPASALAATRFAAALATCGVVTALFLGSGPPAAAAALLAAGLVASRRRRRDRCRDRRSDGAALTAALEILIGELTVGAHPVAAFEAVAAEFGQDPAATVGAGFGTVAARARLGSDVAAGLNQLAATSVVPEYWRRVTVCWQLAAEHGLPMTLLMGAAQRDITDRRRFADRVESGAAGARATASILACLPLLGVVLGELIGAHPLRFLLGPGGWVLTAGVALICAGLWWSDRITDAVTR